MTIERITFQEGQQPRAYKIPEGEVPRGKISARAASLLKNNPKYPDSRGERANLMLAKQAIREALKEKGLGLFSDDVEDQIAEDAYEVLRLVVQ